MSRPANKLPPPINVDGKAAPAGQVPPEKLKEWQARAREFKADPSAKVMFAVDFADLVLIRLDDRLRTTTSPKEILDIAAKGERYVAFAFKEVKE